MIAGGRPISGPTPPNALLLHLGWVGTPSAALTFGSQVQGQMKRKGPLRYNGLNPANVLTPQRGGPRSSQNWLLVDVDESNSEKPGSHAKDVDACRVGG